MLEEPRELLLRAPLPLYPPEPPPNVLEPREPPPLETLRLPTRSPPPPPLPPRFELILPAPALRLPVSLPPALRSRSRALACWRPPEELRSRPLPCCLSPR